MKRIIPKNIRVSTQNYELSSQNFHFAIAVRIISRAVTFKQGKRNQQVFIFCSRIFIFCTQDGVRNCTFVCLFVCVSICCPSNLRVNGNVCCLKVGSWLINDSRFLPLAPSGVVSAQSSGEHLVCLNQTVRSN